MTHPREEFGFGLRRLERRGARLLAVVPEVPAERARGGVVAVVAGAGNRSLFERLAAPVGPIRVVEGGQTMNPSTADLLAALGELGAAEGILLPNNSNVLLAAEQAALHAGRTVEVVPSDSLPAGLAAMLAFGFNVVFTVRFAPPAEAE